MGDNPSKRRRNSDVLFAAVFASWSLLSGCESITGVIPPLNSKPTASFTVGLPDPNQRPPGEWTVRFDATRPQTTVESSSLFGISETAPRARRSVLRTARYANTLTTSRAERSSRLCESGMTIRSSRSPSVSSSFSWRTGCLQPGSALCLAVGRLRESLPWTRASLPTRTKTTRTLYGSRGILAMVRPKRIVLHWSSISTGATVGTPSR